MLTRSGSRGLVRVGALVSWVLCAAVARAEDPFAVQVIESRGRTVTAELVDVDGDGRQDLLQVVTFGMPPDELRVIRIHLQGVR